MRTSLIAAATGLLLLFGASAASANTVTSNFEAPVVTASVNGQDGWLATGPYDQKVVPSAVTDFGTQSLRVSSLVASGSFGDWIFSKPAAPASEGSNQGFTSEFSFKALGKQVNGSHLSISPDNGQGARMSYVRLEDNAAGVQVFFDDVPNHYSAMFDERWIATLDRTKAHTIKFFVTLVAGEANDIVNVSIDGVQKACGTTWENYYRYDPEQAGSGNVVSPIDRLIIQARGTSTLALAEVPEADRGFLIDNVKTTTTAQGEAVACPLPVDPQAGVQGATGTQGATGHTGAQGAAGAAGTTTVIHETAKPVLVGNTIRVLNAPLRRGEKFVSLRAYLLTPSGLHRLPARGRAISVDLRNKPVGNYNIIIKARYRKSNGVVHTVRTTRNLSVAVA